MVNQNHNTTGGSNANSSVLSRLRYSADMESNRIRIEELASKRAELQKVLQIIEEDGGVGGDDHYTNTEKEVERNSNSNGQELRYFYTSSWMNSPSNNSTNGINNTTSSSSFFMMDGKDTKYLTEMNLKKVETELMDVCNEVQRTMDKNNM